MKFPWTRSPPVQREVIAPTEAKPLPKTLSSALRRRPTAAFPYHSPPRRGMWVRYGNQTGILTDISDADVASFTLVDEQGLNVMPVRVPAHMIRQAYIDEIPAPRRPSPEKAAAMGYAR